jgi:hypothetical protein
MRHALWSRTARQESRGKRYAVEETALACVRAGGHRWRCGPFPDMEHRKHAVESECKQTQPGADTASSLILTAIRAWRPRRLSTLSTHRLGLSVQEVPLLPRIGLAGQCGEQL